MKQVWEHQIKESTEGSDRLREVKFFSAAYVERKRRSIHGEWRVLKLCKSLELGSYSSGVRLHWSNLPTLSSGGSKRMPTVIEADVWRMREQAI